MDETRRRIKVNGGDEMIWTAASCIIRHSQEIVLISSLDYY